MTPKAQHKDVEFHARREGEAFAQVFHSASSAFEHLHGSAGRIDVVIWSEQGARAYGGDAAVEDYKADPGASVFERWERKGAQSFFVCKGRVP